MAPVNRRPIGDARQKIECSKIAKKVALKVARSRARRQTSDQILKWILPEQNRRKQLESRPRNQLLSRKFRNGGNSVNKALRMVTNEFSSPSSRVSAIRKTLSRIQNNINRNEAILSVRRQGFGNRFQTARSQFPRRQQDDPTYDNALLQPRLQMDEENASPSFHSKKFDVIRRTIRNDNVRISRTNNYGQNRQQRPNISYVAVEEDDDNAEQNTPTFGQSSSTVSVFSRLSNINPPHQNIGFKVNVSNLSRTVSDEDVRELFSSIGPLLSSRLIRGGEACAIFESLADAKRAIAEFNNRELDGVPMKLSLSNDGKGDATKISAIVPAPAKKSSLKTSNDSSTTAAYSPLRSAQLLKKKNAAVRRQPENRNDEDEDMDVDRDLITKALFNNSTSNGNAPTSKHAKNEQSVQFTVKI